MSNIIKSPYAISTKKEKKLISIQNDFYHEEEAEEEKKELTTAHFDKEKHKFLMEMEAMIEEANVRASEIKADAEAYADDLYEQIEQKKATVDKEVEEAIQLGREDGYEDGFAQGKQDGLQTYTTLIEQAQSIVQSSEQQFDKTIDDAGPVIIELASALVEKMVGKQIHENDDLWNSLLKKVMEEVREHERVKLYVHPDWYEKTIAQKEELEQLLSRTEHLYIYPDAGLLENGCIIESKYGRVDVSLDRQLYELKEQLLQKWGEGESEAKGTTAHRPNSHTV